MKSRNVGINWGVYDVCEILIPFLAIFLIVVGLPVCVELEAHVVHPKLYQDITTGGTIVSDGVVITPRIERAAFKDYDPSVMVRTDDDVLVRIELREGYKSPYYKLVKGERVWVTKYKKMALIPFFECNEYGGWLIFPKDKI